MAKRPYFNSSIDELEQLFLHRSDDPVLLVDLRAELRRRSTNKAARLAHRVEQALRASASFQDAKELSGSPPALPLCEPIAAKLAVECPVCRAANILEPHEGCIQRHCVACGVPYVSEFKYGVLRTVFQSDSSQASAKRKKPLSVAAFVMLLLTAIALLIWITNDIIR